jgi:carbonic anhydrase/acetyltransferase-like protein (isoleucine patch superfamily)
MLSAAGDSNDIKIGSNTSIGDRVTVHVSKINPGGPRPTIIGSDVVIGELAYTSRSF